MRTRPPVKQDEIVETLLDGIISGRFAPGSRLATRVELAQQFQTTSVTVQRAFDRLIQDRFVTVRGKQGTFVAEHPPHLCDYAVVYPVRSTETEKIRYWSVLRASARRLNRPPERNLMEYSGIDKRLRDSEEYRDLERRVQLRGVAGIFFTTSPWTVEGTPILEQPGIPRVCLSHVYSEKHGVPVICLRREELLRMALRRLRERGRKRVAILADRGLGTEEVIEMAAEEGLETRPPWVQYGFQYDPAPCRNLMHMVMLAKPSERPDGLLITDDNLSEYAYSGLIAAGVRTPSDLDVVAHCNFPAPPATLPSVHRIGYSCETILQTGLDLLDRQRAGEDVPKETVQPPVFEEDLPASPPPAEEVGLA